MPIYEYECGSCHQHVEVIQKFSDKPLKKCAHCGGPLQKVLSPPALVFKGTGWYVTDYGRSGARTEHTAKKNGGGNGNNKPAETAASTADKGTADKSKD